MQLPYPQAFFIKSAPHYQQLPPDSGAEVAFLGRSNAGKSSTINRLTRKKLARTSKTPGRTQHINVFALDPSEQCRLIDLPGYGFAQAPQAVRDQWPILINDYLTHRTSLRGLVLLIDSRHDPKPGDLRILEWCKQAELPVHILITKVDKLSRGAAQTAQFKLKQALSLHTTTEDKKNHPHIQTTLQLFSAKSGQGLETLQARLDQLLTHQ